MEIMLRCRIPDVPGMLATLAGAIAEAGGDIQAVEVAAREDGEAIDDLWVTTADLTSLVAHVEALDGVKMIHAGPSRGLPVDVSTRLAAGIQALLTGAASPEEGIATVIGGMLQATSAEVRPPSDWPTGRDRRTLALEVAQGVLVLRRDYRFHDAEADRARLLLQVLEHAASVGASAA